MNVAIVFDSGDDAERCLHEVTAMLPGRGGEVVVVGVARVGWTSRLGLLSGLITAAELEAIAIAQVQAVVAGAVAGLPASVAAVHLVTCGWDDAALRREFVRRGCECVVVAGRGSRALRRVLGDAPIEIRRVGRRPAQVTAHGSA